MSTRKPPKRTTPRQAVARLTRCVSDALAVYYSVPGHHRKAVVLGAAKRVFKRAEVTGPESVMALAALQLCLPDVPPPMSKAELKRRIKAEFAMDAIERAEVVMPERNAKAKRKAQAKR